MSLSQYFEEHEEQAFVAKALATAVAIILLKDFLSGLIPFLLLIFPLVFLMIIRLHAASLGVETMELLREHITFFPMMRTEGERRSEKKPWVTYGIILANALIFYGFELQCPEGFIFDNLVFLPGKPDLLNVPLSAITSMFLHADNGHLWGNMTFLWVVGTAVERRVGGKHFAWLYLATGLLGGLVYVLVEFLFHSEAGHALGASGAIAGIMGIFAVRCYFKSMIFPLPILGIFSLILPISLKIRLNSLVIMSLFFLSDLSGGIGQITGESDSIAHWAHLGGMISGMIIAGFLKLGEDAVEERHLELGIKASQAATGFAGGERSLRIALERSPDNIDALLALARIKSKFHATPEGKESYEKVLELVATARPAELVEIFREYLAKYRTLPASAALVSRLAEAARTAGETELCITCLEQLVEHREVAATTREKALFQLATLLEFTDCADAARSCFARFAAEYPSSILAEKAREKAGGKVHRLPPTVLPSDPAPAPWEPSRYRLVFDGTLSFSADPEATREHLARLFRCDRARIDTLFTGKRAVVKKDLDLVSAQRMKEVFEQTGALCVLEEQEPAGSTAPAGAPVAAGVSGAAREAAVPKAATPPKRGETSRFHCPKCGHPQEKGESCARCGVYFAKLVSAADREFHSFREHLAGGAARPAMAEQVERRWAMWCHLAVLSGLVIPFGNLLGPLAVWLMKRKKSEFIDWHGKTALNYQITFLVVTIAAGIMSAIMITARPMIAVGWLILVLYTVFVICSCANKALKGDYAEIAFSNHFIP